MPATAAKAKAVERIFEMIPDGKKEQVDEKRKRKIVMRRCSVVVGDGDSYTKLTSTASTYSRLDVLLPDLSDATILGPHRSRSCMVTSCKQVRNSQIREEGFVDVEAIASHGTRIREMINTSTNTLPAFLRSTSGSFWQGSRSLIRFGKLGMGARSRARASEREDSFFSLPTEESI